MSWPLSQDYNEAIQSPASNFTDADLKRGEAVCNALGLPMPYSGNFADVYQVCCPDGSRWAVKCFTREALGLRDRYQEISAHLKQAKLPFTVDFSYLEKGMRVAGKWYPVLKMQWVEGLTLNQFVSQHLDKPVMLEALLHLWAKMARYLRLAGVGHCDLQHGNILMVPGANANSLALKLIDYDGMWVPALAGKKSGEVGHPNYQHPQRMREGTYSMEVDRFPVLLVAAALRALKAKGKELWDKYDNGDNLLFKEADLLEPLKSYLFLDLTKSGDALVSRMMDILVKALRGSLGTVPLLEELMPDGAASRSVTAAEPKTTPIPTPVAPSPPATAETPYAQATAGPAILHKPVKGRAMLLVALVSAVAVLGLCGLGAGALSFMGSGAAPDTSTTVAKGNAAPESAKDKNTGRDVDKDKDKPNPDGRPQPKPRARIDYDANADFEAGWKAGTNPNGVWSYGRTTDLRGALILFTRRYVPQSLNNLEQMWDDPTDFAQFCPSIARNSGGAFDNGNVTFRAGALILHPCGVSGHDYTHVIVTAPAAGSYSLTGAFFAQQNSINVDVHVLLKGSSVLDTTITSNGVSRPFLGTFEVSAGDRIDFSVGPNANFVQHAGNTGLDAKITANLTAGPEAGLAPPKDTLPNGQVTPPGRGFQYLSDMSEYNAKASEGRFAKKGALGYGAAGSDRIRVNGQQSPNGISMCALSRPDYSTASYKLGKNAHTFLASVAVNDSAVPPPATPLTFLVLGDGKVLWESKPVVAARSVLECEADVTGIDVLELRVDCPGPNINAQAVWLEPRILLK